MTATDLTVQIDLPGVEIERVKINRAGAYEIKVSSTLAGCSCHKCGQRITKPPGHDRARRLKPLPMLGRETYIIICLPRCQCLDCPDRATTTPQVPWPVRRSPPTTAYERHVILTLMGRTVEEVSVQEGIGYEAVRGIIRRHLQCEVDWNKIEQLAQVGWDEISLKKGHKDFVSIVSARVDGRIAL